MEIAGATMPTGTHSVHSRALTAIHNPVMFSSLVLVDPVVLPPPPVGKVESWTEAFGSFSSMIGFADGALTRRSTWKSKFVVQLLTLLLTEYSPVSSESTRWKLSRRYLCSRHGTRSHSKSTRTARFMRTRVPGKRS